MKVRKRLTVYLARILAAVMIFSTFATAPITRARAADDEEPPVVVLSADFENDAGGFVGRSATAERSQDAAHGGSWSLKVTERTSNWKGTSVDITDKVTAGETYTASVWVKLLDDETADATIQLSAAVKVNGAESYKQFAGAKEKATVGGDWIQLTGTLTMDNWDTVVFYIETTDNATASFYVDDVVITTGAGSQEPDEPEVPDYPIPEPEIPVLDPDLSTEEIMQLLQDAIAEAEAWLAETEFPIQVSETEDGTDVNMGLPWMRASEMEAFKANLAAAYTATEAQAADAYIALQTSINTIKANGSDPYFRFDPGEGQQPIELTAPVIDEWEYRTPLDYRVPSDYAGSTVEVIDYPFADSEGKDQVLKINYVHNGTSTFGGISIQFPLDPVVEIPEGSSLEFDVYYPKSSQGKFMRWRFYADQTGDAYMRDYDYTNLNPDWIGNYQGETWLLTHHSTAVKTGEASTFTFELHGENARPAETSTLILANIRITQPDPNAEPLPNVYNAESQADVMPLKEKYNEDNGLFMVGAIGTGTPTGTRARHYEIFVDGNNLKPDGTHPTGPNWLKDVDGNALRGATAEPGLAEYRFPTAAYQQIRDAEGDYKMHGHTLAWYNQAPSWMTQIIPEHLESGYNGTSEFYGLGNGVTTTVKVDKDVAKRVQYNHIMYVMRHFLTTSEKYGSSEERGIIPFHSWDVLNEEVHESRHSETIAADSNSWRNALKHTNWLVAMSDDDISGDITNHYIYLLFKYAHIAAPNQQMADAYKANYDSLPDYMKLDGHDNNGSIDEYVMEEPPKLTYNDYGTATRSKARTIYNMVKELNTAWQSDPLYDGRPLIEVIGFQGHDSVNPTLATDNQYAMALYASLVDQGLLSGISFSEFDLKLLTDAPGGGATAPAVLNVKQSDALGYEYALMYKLFAKFAPYIDHIMSWGVQGSGWQGSYVLFDQNGKANSGYYGAMNPDRFVLGHSYLDEYFDGEYDSIVNEYEFDLGDLGLYQPKNTIYDLKVVNGSGSGTYARGTEVTIKADAPVSGMMFNGWTSNVALTYAKGNSSLMEATIVMPDQPVTVTATYTTIPSAVIPSSPTTPAAALASISVTTPPTKTAYEVGETFDSTGMVVTATYSDGSTKAVTNYTVTPAGALTAADTAVTISYTEGSVTKTTKLAITVGKSTISQVFTDVPENAWYGEAVEKIYKAGLMNGVSDDEFAPNMELDRAMMATILYRLAGEAEVNSTVDYTDVSDSAYYAKAVAWAAETGVVTGYDDGSYQPNKSITRQEMVIMLWRYAKQANLDMAGADDVLSPYTDVSEVADWAAEAMNWAVGAGLINGRGGNVLAPAATATRAEVATILVRFMELLGK